MKFGKVLTDKQIPEWSKNYISYKSLKREIKEAAQKLPASDEVITALFFNLDRELEKVNTFFDFKQSFIHRRLWILQENYDDKNEELLSALKEIRNQMDKLLWFSELNSKGFRKILKKLDKKLNLETQVDYWETKVIVLSFAAPSQLREELKTVNEWISNLSSVEKQEQINLHKLKNETILKAIQQDNKSELELLLSKEKTRDITLLDWAVENESVKCMQYLIEYIGISLLDYKDINERNLLHRVCIKPSKTKIVEYLLNLEPKLPTQKDFVGRFPLHYAAESNHKTLVTLLLQHAIDHHYYSLHVGFADPIWQDREGFTPLFFGILRGSTEAVNAIIEIGQVHDIDELIALGQKSPTLLHSESQVEFIPDFARSLQHPSSVALACKLRNLELLRLLISKGASVDLADEDGETPLLFAIKSHFSEGVHVLVQEGRVNINLAEKINGWTPLMIACIEGFGDIVDILLSAHADKEVTDYANWTAADHAVFRGYLDIGRLVKPADPTRYALVRPSSDDESVSSTSSGPSVTKKSSRFVSRASRLYGHKYLTDMSMIIITLGSNDIRNPLCHKFIHLAETFQNEDENRRLSLSVSATNATGEFPIIDLPTDWTHPFYPDPIVLFTERPEDVTLRFDLIDTFGSSRNSSILARGTSLLAGDFIFNKSKGFKGATEKTSLRGQQTIPLVQAKDLSCVGTLGLEFFVITPFSHPKLTIGDRYTYYKSVNTKVIGHRGSGMNRKGSKLQVGENTVLSFVTAASLGAEYVEFDVQLTKDLVPVVYHDWTVTETGYDIPLNSITVEQFLNLRRSGHIKEYHTGVSDGQHGLVIPISEEKRRLSTGGTRPNRSRSLSSSQLPRPKDLFEQTQTFKNGKMKGNGPETIQGPFTTLAETLRSVPASAGFNIEVKYPMIDEAEADELNQFQELNIYVDTILECVYNNVEQDRRIIFSSFHPEICLALNLKQPNYPVFFLTDAGTLPMADIRCNSLQGAVRFAKQADLLGIVAASEPILDAPRMVQVIKEMGLLLFTYGILNNEVDNAVAQKNYGVDAVIVDSVLPVRKGLRGD